MPRLHLPMYADAGAGGNVVPAEYIERYQITNVVAGAGAAGTAQRSAGLRAPLEPFGRYASGIGHLNVSVDADNGVRHAFVCLASAADVRSRIGTLAATALVARLDAAVADTLKDWPL